LFVFGGLVVELKAASQLLPEHEAPLIKPHADPKATGWLSD